MYNPIWHLHEVSLIFFINKTKQASPVLGITVFLLDTGKGAELNFWMCMDSRKLVALAKGKGSV